MTTVLLLSEFLQQIPLRMTRWSSRSTTVSRPFVHHFRGRYSTLIAVYAAELALGLVLVLATLVRWKRASFGEPHNLDLRL